MKFLMISKCGEGAQVLYNIGLEGNDVAIHIVEQEYRRNWRGLLRKVDLGSSFITKDTIIIFDFSSLGFLADSLKRVGHKVFGGSRFADKLEEDRAFGLEFMERCGIKHPETKEFRPSQLEKAKEYIRSHDERLVFKPSGNCLPCHLTYCASDSEDLLKFLDYVFRYYRQEIKSFILQDFIEGDLISTELWFDGEKAIYPANHTIECKKFMNDDLGPSSGCSGNLVWPIFGDSYIVDSGIAKVEKELIKENYIGQLDLNAIVNDDGLFGLEWTPRFGYDSIPSFLPLLTQETGKFFADLASGQGSMNLHDGCSAGVRFTIPPYPIEPESVKSLMRQQSNIGIPIRGFKERDKNNLYFYEVMLDGEDLVHGDGTGVIGVANCVCEEPKDAFAGAYKILDDVQIPDVQYRTDLGKVIPKMYEKIKECSYA